LQLKVEARVEMEYGGFEIGGDRQLEREARAAATVLLGIVKEKQKKVKQNSNKPNKIKIK
jgi:hypothetical protein